MRTKYRWDKTLEKWVPYYRDPSSRGVLIIPDLPDVKSPIDGRTIHGRSGLRAHNKEHGVTDIRDFTETWARAEADRVRHFAGDFDHKERKEALARAIEHHERRRP